MSQVLPLYRTPETDVLRRMDDYRSESEMNSEFDDSSEDDSLFGVMRTTSFISEQDSFLDDLVEGNGNIQDIIRRRVSMNNSPIKESPQEYYEQEDNEINSGKSDDRNIEEKIKSLNEGEEEKISKEIRSNLLVEKRDVMINRNAINDLMYHNYLINPTMKPPLPIKESKHDEPEKTNADPMLLSVAEKAKLFHQKLIVESKKVGGVQDVVSQHPLKEKNKYIKINNHDKPPQPSLSSGAISNQLQNMVKHRTGWRNNYIRHEDKENGYRPMTSYLYKHNNSKNKKKVILNTSPSSFSSRSVNKSNALNQHMKSRRSSTGSSHSKNSNRSTLQTLDVNTMNKYTATPISKPKTRGTPKNNPKFSSNDTTMSSISIGSSLCAPTTTTTTLVNSNKYNRRIENTIQVQNDFLSRKVKTSLPNKQGVSPRTLKMFSMDNPAIRANMMQNNVNTSSLLMQAKKPCYFAGRLGKDRFGAQRSTPKILRTWTKNGMEYASPTHHIIKQHSLKYESPQIFRFDENNHHTKNTMFQERQTPIYKHNNRLYPLAIPADESQSLSTPYDEAFLPIQILLIY